MSNRYKLVILGLLLAATSISLTAQTYTLQAFHIPYAPNASTYAQGINNRGAIVGHFAYRGFKRDANGVFELPIDDPNAGQFTVPFGINDSGVISGAYFNSSLHVCLGFLRDHGVFTDYNAHPGWNTWVMGINNKGDLVGQIITGNGFKRGFVMLNGVPSGVNYPGGDNTVPFGIAADGTVVGYFLKNGSMQAFMRGPAGHFKALQIPGAIESQAYGINNASHQIVGLYTTQGQTHGFVYDYLTNAMTTVDWPDMAVNTTVITGINSNGVIVGWAQAPGRAHAFSFIGTPQ